jgi:hypothetical protein
MHRSTSLLLGIAACLLLPANIGRASEASAPAESLESRVLSYLDEPDAARAEDLLRALLADPETTIEQAGRIIQTGRTYGAQPVGMMPDERLVVRDRTYQFALAVPLTYQPS